MSRDYASLSYEEHQKIFNEQVLPNSKLLQKSSHEHPRMIILGGQPGAGKGGLTRAARSELNNDVVVIDPDAQRDYHPQLKKFQKEHPYTWSSDTHADASKWADQLLEKSVALKKNIVFDITLSNGQWTADLIKDLQSKGYEVEVRAIATHKLESELGVDARFSGDIDQRGFARYVPEGARDAIDERHSASLRTTSPTAHKASRSAIRRPMVRMVRAAAGCRCARSMPMPAWPMTELQGQQRGRGTGAGPAVSRQ